MLVFGLWVCLCLIPQWSTWWCLGSGRHVPRWSWWCVFSDGCNGPLGGGSSCSVYTCFCSDVVEWCGIGMGFVFLNTSWWSTCWSRSFSRCWRVVIDCNRLNTLDSAHDSARMGQQGGPVGPLGGSRQGLGYWAHGVSQKPGRGLMGGWWWMKIHGLTWLGLDEWIIPSCNYKTPVF